MTTDAPVLLYDGTCGFCNASVQFIIARDPKDVVTALRRAEIALEQLAIVIIHVGRGLQSVGNLHLIGAFGVELIFGEV